MLTTTGVEFEFPEAGPDMFVLTCTNHPDGRWLTKNPHTRSLHWSGWQPMGIDHSVHGWRECECPFSDLRVVVDADGRPAK